MILGIAHDHEGDALWCAGEEVMVVVGHLSLLSHFLSKSTFRYHHPVTLSPRHVLLDLDLAHSQPQSGAPQSASVAYQSNQAVFPTPAFLTSPPSLPSLPPFPVQITDPAVDPDSALSYHPLGSVASSFVELSRMIAAADSPGRSSLHPASRCVAANPPVSPRPR